MLIEFSGNCKTPFEQNLTQRLERTEDICEKVALDSKFHISSLKICPETNVRTEAQSQPDPKHMKFRRTPELFQKIQIRP